MNRIMAIFVICMIFYGSSDATEITERNYIYQDEYQHGGFGGPILRVSEINGKTESIAGIRGAWLINHHYYVGGAVYTSFDELESTQLNFNYGGLWLGMKFDPSKLIHYSADLLIGAGELREDHSSSNRNYNDDRKDSLFVVEPSINMNINLSKFTELELSLSYRLVNGSDQTTLNNTDLSGASFTLSMMFGIF